MPGTPQSLRRILQTLRSPQVHVDSQIIQISGIETLAYFLADRTFIRKTQGLAGHGHIKYAGIFTIQMVANHT